MKRKNIIEGIRLQLLKRREDLLDDISSHENLLNRLGTSNEPGDVADFATDILNGEINAQMANVEFREIANIETALCRIQNGTYGVCEACSKNIPLNRLKAIPHASVCIDCKRLSEENGTEEGSTPDWSVILDAEGAFSDSDASIS